VIERRRKEKMIKLLRILDVITLLKF